MVRTSVAERMRPEIRIVMRPSALGGLAGCLHIFSIDPKTGYGVELRHDEIGTDLAGRAVDGTHAQLVDAVRTTLVAWLADQPDDTPHS